jgi:hypothetical protein
LCAGEVEDSDVVYQTQHKTLLNGSVVGSNPGMGSGFSCYQNIWIGTVTQPLLDN